jgi:hypothetical protein
MAASTPVARWQKSRRSKVNGNRGVRSGSLGFSSWVARFLVGYMVFICAQALLLSFILHISLGKLVLPVVLLLLPACVSGPMIYWSRAGGGLRLGLFITAIVVHFIPFALAIEYSACVLGYLPLSMAREMVPFVFITAALVSVSLYFSLRGKVRLPCG